MVGFDSRNGAFGLTVAVEILLTAFFKRFNPFVGKGPFNDNRQPFAFFNRNEGAVNDGLRLFFCLTDKSGQLLGGNEPFAFDIKSGQSVEIGNFVSLSDKIFTILVERRFVRAMPFYIVCLFVYLLIAVAVACSFIAPVFFVISGFLAAVMPSLTVSFVVSALRTVAVFGVAARFAFGESYKFADLSVIQPAAD